MIIGKARAGALFDSCSEPISGFGPGVANPTVFFCSAIMPPMFALLVFRPSFPVRTGDLVISKSDRCLATVPLRVTVRSICCLATDTLGRSRETVALFMIETLPCLSV
jgi:hypothetical protein